MLWLVFFVFFNCFFLEFKVPTTKRKRTVLVRVAATLPDHWDTGGAEPIILCWNLFEMNHELETEASGTPCAPGGRNCEAWSDVRPMPHVYPGVCVFRGCPMTFVVHILALLFRRHQRRHHILLLLRSGRAHSAQRVRARPPTADVPCLVLPPCLSLFPFLSFRVCRGPRWATWQVGVASRKNGGYKMPSGAPLGLLSARNNSSGASPGSPPPFPSSLRASGVLTFETAGLILCFPENHKTFGRLRKCCEVGK